MFKFKYLVVPPCPSAALDCYPAFTHADSASLCGVDGSSVVSEDSGTASIALTVSSSSQYSPATLPKQRDKNERKKLRSDYSLHSKKKHSSCSTGSVYGRAADSELSAESERKHVGGGGDIVAETVERFP